MMLYHGSLSIVLVHIICYICESAEQDNILRHDDLSEEIREDATAKLSSFLENNSMKSLPIHSREVRPASCSEGVEEEFILYRFDYEDLLGQSASLLVPSQRVLHGVMTLEAVHKDEIMHLTHYPYLNCLDYDDPDLIKHIKENVLIPYDGQPLNLSEPINPGGEFGLPLAIDKLVFGGKLKNGFFIEAGSQDGEIGSNTIYFETSHNWSGLLVEAHPIWFKRGLERHRRASHVNSCLGIKDKPHFENFDSYSASQKTNTMGGIVQEPSDHTFQHQCLPLASLLLAMDNPTVHYFSLDIEGAELQVLKTVPWEKVDIWVVSVETHLAGEVFPGSREDIIDYMESVGYNIENTWKKGEITKDDLFVRKDIELILENSQKKKIEL